MKNICLILISMFVSSSVFAATPVVSGYGELNLVTCIANPDQLESISHLDEFESKFVIDFDPNKAPIVSLYSVKQGSVATRNEVGKLNVSAAPTESKSDLVSNTVNSLYKNGYKQGQGYDFHTVESANLTVYLLTSEYIWKKPFFYAKIVDSKSDATYEATCEHKK